MTGDANLWRRKVPFKLDISSLTDAAGRNLLHNVMNSVGDHPELTRAIIDQCRSAEGDWRGFINQQDNFGRTPRSLAVKFGKKQSEALLIAQAGVLTTHYQAAVLTVPKIQFIARDGKVTQSSLDTLPSEAEWAKPAFLRLRRELAEIAAHMPELAAANAARGGFYAITEGQVSDFQRYVLKKSAPNRSLTVAHSYVWRDRGGNNLVTVYAAENYVDYSPHVNVAAHELTHAADAEIVLIKTANYQYDMVFSYGSHSDKPMFQLACEIDAVIGGSKSISSIYKGYIAAGDSYQSDPDHEYFALASNHIGLAAPPAYSPLLAAYQQIVLRPMLTAQRDGEIARAQHLKGRIEDAKPERALDAHILTHLEAYRTAKLADPADLARSSRMETARAELMASKADIEARLMGHMTDTVAAAEEMHRHMASVMSRIKSAPLKPQTTVAYTL